MTGSYQFDLPDHHKSIIKVIGVGGGGSNAVTHMYNQGIKDVEFVVCNTDLQALRNTSVPTKLQIGAHLTHGLGAGANPEKGKNAAVESKEEIREFLSEDTKMVFITAGMGGGTGTGAAPVIAKIAKELDILTVGIVTVPFGFEGKKKKQQAERGIKELKSQCDTVLVIVNDKLREIYGNLSIRQAFAQADNILTTAAKSIAEIITVTSHVNVDFEDVKTVMRDSGAAVMGSAVAEGEQRASRAVEEALASPLLDSTNVHGAQKILLSITFGEEAELTMDELNEITDFIEEKAGNEAETIWGQGIDPELGKACRVTVIATGFDHDPGEDVVEEKKVFDLERDHSASEPSASEPVQNPQPQPQPQPQQPSSYIRREPEPPRNNEDFSQPENNQDQENNNGEMKFHVVEKPSSQSVEPEETGEMEEKRRVLLRQAEERIRRLKGMSSHDDVDPEAFKEKLEVPAYQRKNVKLKDVPHSSERNVSRYSLNDDNEILGNNKFLHDNVD